MSEAKIQNLEDCLDYKFQKKDIPRKLLNVNGALRREWAWHGDKLLASWHGLWLANTFGFEAAKDSPYISLISNRALRGIAVHYDIIDVFPDTIVSKARKKKKLQITDVNEDRIGTIVEACFYSIWLDSNFETGYEWIKMYYFDNDPAREAGLRSYNNTRVVSRKLLPRELAKAKSKL